MRQAGDGHAAEVAVPSRDEIAARLLGGRDGGRDGPRRARHRRGRGAPAHRRAGGRAGAGGAGQPPQARRRRRLHARVRADLRGGHHPDVPGGGAAAHPRQGHRRRADRREARRGALGEASGRLRQPVRQRLHLRADAHGPPGAAGRGQGRGTCRHPQAPGGALRRALHPPGPAPGHEDPGRQLRARPHHQGGAGPGRALRGARLPLLLRHAGRARQDGRRRRPLLRRYVSAIEAIGEAKGPRARGFPRADGAAQRVREALRHPSALRAGQGGAPRPRAAAAADRAGRWPRAGRGSASPSTPRSRTASISRSACSPAPSAIPRSTAGRGSASPCRPTASAPSPCCAGCSGCRSIGASRIPVRLVKGAYWDSEIKWAQERGLADYPVFTRKVAHRRVLSRLRARSCWPIRQLSSRSSPRTTRTRSLRSTRRPAAACSSSSGCTAWARRCTRRWSAAAS